MIGSDGTQGRYPGGTSRAANIAAEKAEAAFKASLISTLTEAIDNAPPHVPADALMDAFEFAFAKAMGVLPPPWRPDGGGK
jgi:hypothetical protein